MFDRYDSERMIEELKDAHFVVMYGHAIIYALVTETNDEGIYVMFVDENHKTHVNDFIPYTEILKRNVLIEPIDASNSELARRDAIDKICKELRFAKPDYPLPDNPKATDEEIAKLQRAHDRELIKAAYKRYGLDGYLAIDWLYNVGPHSYNVRVFKQGIAGIAYTFSLSVGGLR